MRTAFDLQPPRSAGANPFLKTAFTRAVAGKRVIAVTVRERVVVCPVPDRSKSLFVAFVIDRMKLFAVLAPRVTHTVPFVGITHLRDVSARVAPLDGTMTLSFACAVFRSAERFLQRDHGRLRFFFGELKPNFADSELNTKVVTVGFDAGHLPPSGQI